MTIKSVANTVNGIALVQAVVAPALMVIGHITHNNIIRNIGAVWCGLIAIDTARTTANATNQLLSNSDLQDRIEELEDKIEEQKS